MIKKTLIVASLFWLFSLLPVGTNGIVGFNQVSAKQDDQTTVEDIESRGIVPCTIESCDFCYLLQMLERINVFLLSLAFAVAIFFVVISGFAYIVSIGDSGTMGFAKEGLKYSIGGFVICLFSFLAIHVTYIISGYTEKGGKEWWKIQCETEIPENIMALEKKEASKAYANEIPVDSLGGRNNPISLENLIKENIKSLPASKYFFVHGLGGQSLDETAAQLLTLTETIKREGKEVYVALPKEDISGKIIGSKKVSLNDFLDSLANPIIKGDESGLSQAEKQKQFFDLAVSMLIDNTSSELPVVVGDSGKEVPDFNEIWTQLNWTGMAGDGDKPKFEPKSTVANGLSYEEGNGPFFYDPERYDGEIPDDQTHIQVNLKPDGSLDTKDPVTVLNVAPGVSEEALNNYLTQVVKVLLATEEKYTKTGEKKDFIYGLTDLLSRSAGEKAATATSTSTESSTVQSTETTEKETGYSNSNSNYNSQSNDTFIDRTGGAGVLPDKIAQDSNSNKKLTDSEIDKLINQILKDSAENNSGSGSSSNNNGSSSNNGSTGNTGNNNSSTGNGNDWSNTSVSSSGYKLNEKEKERLEKMIAEDLKEANLNVPKEFVMCIIQRESAFKPEALNNRGEYSIGLMQINKNSSTDKAALAGLKKYAPNLYEKLKKHHGSDAKILDTASMQSKNDPEGEKGMTNIALGISYLKKINAENKRGNGLRGADDWDNLAAGYNCGPAGCKGGRTDYSTAVTACTKTMMAKNQKTTTTTPSQ